MSSTSDMAIELEPMQDDDEDAYRYAQELDHLAQLECMQLMVNTKNPNQAQTIFKEFWAKIQG